MKERGQVLTLNKFTVWGVVDREKRGFESTCPMSRPDPFQAGFTLLEVMIGTVVLAMMVFIIWQISSANLDAKARTEKRDEIFQMARLAVQRVVDDVNMAFLVTNSELLGKTRDGANIETAFIGDDKGGQDSLNFNSMSHWRMFRNAKESEQVEVGYYVERVPDSEEETYRLMRRENPVMDNDVLEGGKVYPVAEGINGFEFEYYDGRQHEWTRNWNSKDVDQKDKLPRAVKITLSFPDPEDSEEKISFSTIAFIELWQFPIEF